MSILNMSSIGEPVPANFTYKQKFNLILLNFRRHFKKKKILFFKNNFHFEF